MANSSFHRFEKVSLALSGRHLGDVVEDIDRHIGMASSAMRSMQRVWRQQRLSLHTKLHVRLYIKSASFHYCCMAVKRGRYTGRRPPKTAVFHSL